MIALGVPQAKGTPFREWHIVTVKTPLITLICDELYVGIL